MQTSLPNEPKKYSPFEGFIPFFWLSIACVGGVVLADLLSAPVWVWMSGFTICLAAWGLACFLPKGLVFSHRLRRWTRADQRLPGVMLAIIFFVGGWRLTVTQPTKTPQSVAFFNGRETVQLIGLVIQPPDVRDSHTNLTLQVESLQPLARMPENFDPETVSGKLILQVPSNRDWAYGDRLLVTGKLTLPYESDDFSYADYLANKGIHSLMAYARVDWVETDQGDPTRAFIYSLRQKSYDVLLDIFPSPEAELLSGILLGRDKGISQDLQHAFQLTGMTHIIAISGFNITILAGLFSSIFTRLFGHKIGAVAAILGILGYAIMVGAEAAVVRAAIIGALGVLGGMFGRRQNGLNSLGLAAMGMLLFEPNILWDIGFQLSVAATLGLILYAQPLEEWFIKYASRWLSEEQANNIVGPVSEIFLFTLAAQLMTLPIIAYHFGEVSWLALIANPLVLPAQSLVMLLGGLALLSGLVLPGFGKIIGVLALPFVRYTVRMVTLVSQLPGADLKLPDFNILWLFVFYALLFILTLVPIEKRKSLLRKAFSTNMALLILTGSVVFAWNHALSRPDGKLLLTLLDHEGTILIQTPDGKTVLVGGGPSPSSLNQNLGQMLPPGEKRLDALVVASPARDDINALTGALSVYSPGIVLWGAAPDANQTTATVYGLLKDKGISITSLAAGQVMDLGSNIKMDVLWVGERGAVLCLTWNNFNAYLPTGKIEKSSISLPKAPNVVLLEDDLTTEDISLHKMTGWSPAVILMPLEESDLPLLGEHEILSLLADYPVVTTLDHRWVRVSTDGKNLWVTGE
ncbi:MAG: ComEC/Rec2 family competence protein [Chloroflexota bacterium]|nr:ComEC/Rec2 family competence protein [Chloroflexota bacterium]